jgi:hypothetical protein
VPAISDCGGVDLVLCNIGQLHRIKLIEFVNLGRCGAGVITIDGMLDKFGTVMCFEAPDDPLVLWLNVSSKIWSEVQDFDVLNIIWNNMT